MERAGFERGTLVLGFRLRGGGYLGIGMGGEGEGVHEVVSFWGGFEGREERRLSPGSDARIGIENVTLNLRLFQFGVQENVVKWIISSASSV